jgi:hypothetical protein
MFNPLFSVFSVLIVVVIHKPTNQIFFHYFVVTSTTLTESVLIISLVFSIIYLVLVTFLKSNVKSLFIKFFLFL